MRAMIRQMILLFGIAVGMVPGSNSEPKRPVVVTRQGIIRGVLMNTVNNRPIYGFKGIRYATPPVGDLRFRAPVPAVPWNGTWDADTDGNQCPQFSLFRIGEIVGDEDCLYLNVYTTLLPSNQRTELLPVLVFFHGGAWKIGSNNSTLYGPDYLLDEDIILVTINYRIGMLGFLSTGDDVAPGNFGSKDQVLSLTWVRDNIRYFCGDPNKVTISGQSAGGSSVELLTLTDKTAGLTLKMKFAGLLPIILAISALKYTSVRKFILFGGLFRAYIAQSGSAIAYFVQQPRIPYARRAFQFGKLVGCNSQNSKDLVNCLRNRKVSDLMTKEKQLNVWTDLPFILWGPTVEPNIDSALLTEMAIDVYATGKFRNMPCMTGVVQHDGFAATGVFYNNRTNFRYFLDHFKSLVPYVLYYYNQNVDGATITAAIKDYYYGDDFSQSLEILLRNTTNLASDCLWNAPCKRVLDIKSRFGKGPSYFYTFHYTGQYSYSSLFPVPGLQCKYGAVHTDELLYLFPGHRAFFGAPNDNLNANDRAMKDKMVELWSSFVKNCKPTIQKPKDIVGWKEYSSKYSHLQLGDGPKPVLIHKSEFLKERMKFWMELFDTTSKN